MAKGQWIGEASAAPESPATSTSSIDSLSPITKINWLAKGPADATPSTTPAFSKVRQAISRISDASDKESTKTSAGSPPSMRPTAHKTRLSESDLFDDPKLDLYMSVLALNKQSSISQASWDQETKTTPLFTWPVKTIASSHDTNAWSSSIFPSVAPFKSTTSAGSVFQQYSILGTELNSDERPPRTPKQSAVFLNTNAPWSAFICGSQGSGKSYTMSCILEGCLMAVSPAGETPNPLAGIVFAYDSHFTGAVCEAAYLATQLPVKVLVSPSNFRQMKAAYEAIPGTKGRVKVYPLFLKEDHLNTQRMRSLMAFNEKGGSIPLYMEVIIKILKDMAISASANAKGFDYQAFQMLLKGEKFDSGQKGPLGLRLQLLDGFIDQGYVAKQFKRTKIDIFKAEPGTLTVVDLTDAFVDPASACVMFDICLSLFLEDRSGIGKVIALDEAHKFMSEGDASDGFTQSLLRVIREQRHKGARIIVATQEPTISPKLLDLCSMTFVHRFTSPEWFHTLQHHLAGASEFRDADSEGNRQDRHQLLKDIVRLNVGESLLFAPSAMLDVVEGKAVKLGLAHVKFKTRPRITADGGRSVMAA